jgi:hypothetical protein
MKPYRSILGRALVLMTLIASLTVLSTRLQADAGSCGGVTITLPFNDVKDSSFFCQIAAAYFSGLANGTTATTFSPTKNVTREQMAAFTTRTLDQSLKRGSRRAALKQFWTPTSTDGLGITTLGLTDFPFLVESDGTDLWVANSGSGTVSRVRASDGKLLETWTGANFASGVLIAKGKVFVTGINAPGTLYQIDPTQAAGAVTTITTSIDDSPQGIAFDGSRIWTANIFGSVSIITLNPLSITTVPIGIGYSAGILYDGANMWVANGRPGTGKLLKLDSNGSIIQTVDVGSGPNFPVFDGTNIWVPNFASNTVTVVRASTGAVVATLTGNGLSAPQTAAFDGERILVANTDGSSVSLWKATDLSPLGSVSLGSTPVGTCSDGLNFWITLRNPGKLVRF